MSHPLLMVVHTAVTNGQCDTRGVLLDRLVGLGLAHVGGRTGCVSPVGQRGVPQWRSALPN
ncbi:MAG: hypothetical protein ACJ790_14000 [Myxococcaceae bacterium]